MITKNWLMTGTEMPRCGSIIVASPKPMLIAIVWPAMISASKIICRQKPIATPIRTSCSTVKPVASDKSNGCVTGINGEITTVTATLSAMRTRGGTRRAPNTGATMTTPAMRKNGHTRQREHVAEQRFDDFERDLHAQPISDGMLLISDSE